MNSLVASILVLGAGSTAIAQTFKTVAVYDAPTHPNGVDVRLPSPAFYASFAATVSGAFASNKGGVINFDATHSFPWNVAGLPLWNARYGVAGVNNCALSFGRPVHVANMVGKPWVPVSGSPNGPGALVTVGATPLAFKMQATQPAFGPNVPITRAGLTVLQRAGVRQKVTVTFIQSAAPALTTTIVIPACLPGLSTSDTFVGANASPGSSIIAVEVRSFDGASGAVLPVAVDDLAFSVN